MFTTPSILAPITSNTPTIPTTTTASMLIHGHSPLHHLAMVPLSLQYAAIADVSHAAHAVGFAGFIRLARVISILAVKVGPFDVKHRPVGGGRLRRRGRHVVSLLLVVLRGRRPVVVLMLIVAIATAHAAAADAAAANPTRGRRMMRVRRRRSALILGRSARQAVRPPASPHSAIAVVHGALTVGQAASAGDFASVPSLISVSIRERHARHPVRAAGTAAAIVLVPAIGRPFGIIRTSSIRNLRSGRGGFHIAIRVTMRANGQLSYGRSLLIARGGIGSILTRASLHFAPGRSSPAVPAAGLAAAAAIAAIPFHPQHFLDAAIGTVDQHDLPSAEHFLFAEADVGMLGAAALVVVGGGFGHGMAVWLGRRGGIGSLFAGGLIEGGELAFWTGLRLGIAHVGLLASIVMDIALWGFVMLLLRRCIGIPQMVILLRIPSSWRLSSGTTIPASLLLLLLLARQIHWTGTGSLRRRRRAHVIAIVVVV